MRGFANFGDERLPERFWDKVSPCPMSGCWLWTGMLNGNGYGLKRRGGRGTGHHVVHRFAFQALVGPVPADLDLDHLCRVRCCCNPAHLEPVSRRENILRGIGPQVISARMRQRTYCHKGHPYSEENTWLNPTTKKRECRECNRARARRGYHKRMSKRRGALSQ